MELLAHNSPLIQLFKLSVDQLYNGQLAELPVILDSFSTIPQVIT